MNTFCIILQKHVKSKKIIYSNNIKEYQLFSSNNYHEDFLNESMIIYHTIYYIINNNSSTTIKEHVENKFRVSNIHIFDNLLLSKSLKDKLFDIFCNSQRTYAAFARLANLYRYKKSKTVISDDLTLNPLNELDKHTFILIQNRCKYLFSIKDLINIVETSLLNNYRFFAEPLSPKNPFNNVKFTISTLCNIYFKMKNTTLSSQLFDMYYTSSFSLEKFRIDNEAFLRDASIKNFIYKSPSNTLRPSIMQMLNSNIYTKQLKIDNDFPNDILAEVFRPFLYNFFVIHYNFHGLEKNNSYEIDLYEKLVRFYKYNPNFGKKYIKHTNIFGVLEKTMLINSNHLNYYNKQIINNIIDDNCSYALNTNITSNEQTINRNNVSGISLTALSETIRINTHIRTPVSSPIETPNGSPSNSSDLSQSLPETLSVTEIYNQINNELYNETSSETTEDISVS